MENINIFPMVYKHRMNKAGEVPLVICVTLDNKPVAYAPLKKKVLLSDWDDKEKSVRKSAPNATLLNALIRKRKAELDAEFTKKQLMGVVITKHRLKEQVSGKAITSDFYAFCKEWLPIRYKNKGTLRTWNNEVDKLKEFQSSLDIADITYDFLMKYQKYLSEVKKNEPNTRWKSFKFINTMILDAIRRGQLPKESNPFLEFKRPKYQDPEKFDLQTSATAAVEKITLRADVPDMVRKTAIYFLLMAYSGLRFEDAIRFDPDEHLIGDGRLLIRTEKFDVTVRMKLSSQLQRIVNLVRENRLTISNAAFNRWLKVVFVMAGLPETAGRAHNGRHLFGAKLAEAGVPKEKAKKLLGHRSIKSTDVYYHITDKALDKAIDDIDDKDREVV